MGGGGGSSHDDNEAQSQERANDEVQVSTLEVPRRAIDRA